MTETPVPIFEAAKSPAAESKSDYVLRMSKGPPESVMSEYDKILERYRGPTDSVKYTTPCCMWMCFEDPYKITGPLWYIARAVTAPCFCCSNECVEGTGNWVCNTFCCFMMCCGCGWGGPCSCGDCWFRAMR